MSHSAAVESRHTAHNTGHTTLAVLTHTIGSGFTYCRFLYHHPQFLDFFIGVDKSILVKPGTWLTVLQAVEAF